MVGRRKGQAGNERRNNKEKVGQGKGHTTWRKVRLGRAKGLDTGVEEGSKGLDENKGNNVSKGTKFGFQEWCGKG